MLLLLLFFLPCLKVRGAGIPIYAEDYGEHMVPVKSLLLTHMRYQQGLFFDSPAIARLVGKSEYERELEVFTALPLVDDDREAHIRHNRRLRLLMYYPLSFARAFDFPNPYVFRVHGVSPEKRSAGTGRFIYKIETKCFPAYLSQADRGKVLEALYFHAYYLYGKPENRIELIYYLLPRYDALASGELDPINYPYQPIYTVPIDLYQPFVFGRDFLTRVRRLVPTKIVAAKSLIAHYMATSLKENVEKFQGIQTLLDATSYLCSD